MLFASSLVRAATLTWDGNGAVAGLTDAGGVWLGVDPWWNGTTNVAWTSGDSAVFGNGGTGGAVTLASPTTVDSLTFNSFSGIYTLGSIGQTITLNNGITMNSGAGGVNVISSITLGAVQTWLNNSSSLFSVDGAVDNGGFQLTIGGSGNTTIAGIISGSGGLTKSGEGATTISGVNTYSGETNILAGMLNANSSAALGDGSASNTLIFNGGTLQAGGNITSPATRGVTLNSTGIIDTNGFAVGIDGIISGSGGLTKNGAGTLTLTAANTYTGATTISGGTLTLSGANGAIASSSSITLGNKGTFTISNTSAANNANRIGNATGFSINGGTFNFLNDGSNTVFSETLGTLTLTRGALTFNTSQAGASGSSILTLASISRSAGGGTVLFSGTGFGVDTRNQVRVTTALSSQNIGGILPWALIKDGSTYDLAVGGAAGGAITKYTGYTTTSGDPAWVAATNARPNADILLMGNRSLNSLVLDNGIDLSGPAADFIITIGSATQAGLIVQTGGFSSILRNNREENKFNFGTREAIFHIIGTLFIDSRDSDIITGTGGVTKTGAGTLTLGSAAQAFRQTLTGNVTLAEGLFEIYTRNDGFGNAANNIRFNGGHLTVRDATARTFNNPLTLNADATITLDRTTASTGAGIIQTFGTLAINDNPTLTLDTGVSVTSGTQQMTVGAVTLNSNATFAINNGATAATNLTLGAMNDGGAGRTITKQGNGSLTWGAVTLSGAHEWENDGAGTFTAGAVTGGAQTLTLSGTGNGLTTLTGGLSFSGAGGLVIGKAGTNGTTISGGTITLGGTGGITINSGSSAVVLGANTVAASQSWVNRSDSSFTVSGLTAATANTLTLSGTGNGLTTLTGGLTFSGAGGLIIGKSGTNGTTISGGTITLGGTGGITINSGSSALALGAATISAAQSWTNNSSSTMSTIGIQAINSQLTLRAGTIQFGNFTNTGAGGVVINGATAQAGHAAAFGTGTLTLTSGKVSSNGVTARTFTNNLVINGSVTLGDGTNNGLLTFSSGTKTFTGSNTITLDSAVTFSNNALLLAAGSNTTFNSAASALVINGGLNSNNGTDTLTFNTGTNAVTMSGTLAGTGRFILAGSGTNITVGVMTGTANVFEVNSTTGGAYAFNGASTFTGGVTLNSGTLNINSVGVAATNGPLGNGGTFTINGGTIDNTSGAALAVLHVNPIVVGGNFGFGTSGGTALNNLTLPGTVNLGAQTRTITAAGAGVLTWTGVISNGGLIKGGTGAVTLAGANTFTGGVTLNSGTLNINSIGVAATNGPLGNGGTFTINGGTINNTSGAALAVRNVNPIVVGGNFGFGTSGGAALNNLTLPGTVNLGAQTRTITAAGAGVLTWTGVISNGGLIKGGTGAVALAGANTFTGGVTLNSGTLNINSVGAAGANGPLGNGGTFTINGGTIDNTSGAALAVLHVNPIVVGGNFGFGTSGGTALNNLTLPGTVNLGGATRTITTNGAGVLTWSGAISNGGLTKSGAGTLALTGANTYTGTTTVSGGTLQLNGTGVVISTDGDPATTSDIVIDGGTLQIAASEQIANTGSIDMSSGAFNFGAASGLTETIDKFTNTGGTFVTGANTLIGVGATITWAGGTNTVNTGGTVKDKHVVVTGGTNTVQQGGTLEVQTGGGSPVGLFFGGTASPTITLDSSASTAGKMILDQNVTVDNTLTSGTAQILNGGALANAGFIDMDAGTRTFTVNNGSAATDMSVSARLTNGGLTKAGAGALSLSGNNNYTGATTVSGGILGLEGSGTINTTSGITVAAGATLLYNSSTALTVAPTLSGSGTGSRAILGGEGTINAALTTLNDLGDVLSPGATATSNLGILSFATGQTWASNSYDWEINDWAASVAGTNIDKIQVTGVLNLSAAAANSYVLNILSLKNDDTSGLVGAGGGAAFSETTKSWTIITASGGITGFAASEWNLNAAGFLDADGGTWSINQNVNDLVLTYTAIPEPRAALLGGIGLLLLLRRRR